MNYKEIVDKFQSSDNPLVKKMIDNSQEVIDYYKNLLKSRLTEKEKIDNVLKNSIVEINYKHSHGKIMNYRCSSNPYFIALLSVKKFSEYLNTAKLISIELKCNTSGKFATWDLVRNKRIEFTIMRTKINPFNAIKLGLSEDSKELIQETFRKLKPSDKDSKNGDLKTLFKL